MNQRTISNKQIIAISCWQHKKCAIEMLFFWLCALRTCCTIFYTLYLWQWKIIWLYIYSFERYIRSEYPVSGRVMFNIAFLSFPKRYWCDLIEGIRCTQPLIYSAHTLYWILYRLQKISRLPMTTLNSNCFTYTCSQNTF